MVINLDETKNREDDRCPEVYQFYFKWNCWEYPSGEF